MARTEASNTITITRRDAGSCTAPRRRPSYRLRRDRHMQPTISHESLRLSLVRPVAKGSLVPGTVVWAHVPFEDTPVSKLRPAVIIRVVGRDATVLPATSSESRRRYSGRHSELVDPAAAGLQRPTGVRHVEVTLDLIDVVAVIGELGGPDRNMILATPEDHERELGAAA